MLAIHYETLSDLDLQKSVDIRLSNGTNAADRATQKHLIS